MFLHIYIYIYTYILQVVWILRRTLRCFLVDLVVGVVEVHAANIALRMPVADASVAVENATHVVVILAPIVVVDLVVAIAVIFCFEFCCGYCSSSSPWIVLWFLPLWSVWILLRISLCVILAANLVVDLVFPISVRLLRVVLWMSLDRAVTLAAEDLVLDIAVVRAVVVDLVALNLILSVPVLSCLFLA